MGGPVVMIDREPRDEATILRLAHGRANALDLELVTALERALADEQARAEGPLVLTGAGRSFCAGVDLVRLLAEPPDYTARFLDALEALLSRLLGFPRPIVAALNGHAVAGGCVIACACDLRVAARGGAKLGLPELAVGVPFPALALEIARATLAPAAFRRVTLGGAYHGVEEALELGLVDELVEPEALLERAGEHAARLGAIPALTYAAHRRALWAPAVARAAEEDRAALAAAWTSARTRAAVGAYVARTLGK